uniref:Uncharacterized protein n=1 Tax=Bionectria ochroleuca TaxID=29856 RepID=A0A0B7JYC2_BIOOC
MSHLSSSQSQVEIGYQPIVRPFRWTVPLPTHPPPSQLQPPSFSGTGQTLDAEGRVSLNEGRMPDGGRTHVQATVNMDGSGSHIQPSAATSSTTPVIDLEEHMRSSVLLHPKTKKRTWPLLPVAYEGWSKEEYDSSFKKVVEYLKDAVDYHETLRDRARNILYRLMMVGSSLGSAKPSVLVLCNYTDWGSLRSLLMNMPNEYNCIAPTWKIAGLSRMSKLKPILWLYLCPTSSEPFKRLYGVPVGIECSWLVTMCGSLVEYEGRQSTISLTLDIDGEDRLLTVEHIFQDNELENDKSQMTLDPESLASIESNIEQWDCLNDSEADISTDSDTDSNHDGTHMDRKSPATSVNYNPLQVSHEQTRVKVEAPARRSHSHKQGERVEPPNSLPHRSPYLDWACLRLVNYQMAPRQQCNLLLRRGKPPGLLKEVAIKPSTHAVPVFMISGILGVRSGRLMESPNFLGSPKAQDLCETWAIILDHQGEFHPGESGSIVVDQETLEIYGHLVGSDMFGYGHVVPFSRTIEQIRTAFDVDNAGLPTLEKSGSHQEADMYSTDDGELMFLLRNQRPNISKVQQLIERGADVNGNDEYGETLLCRAASRGHLDMVEFLLEIGADLSVPNRLKNETPLWRAASAGHLAVTKLLLENGADLSVPNYSGETLLSRAASEGHIAVTKLLLENGADLSVPNRSGETPVWRAASEGHLAVVELLLENGADLSIPNRSGETPIWGAAIKGHLAVIKLLLENGADLSIPNRSGETPIWGAAIKGHLAVIKLLLENGADLSVPNRSGETPVWRAASEGHLAVVELLLENGAKLSASNKSGELLLSRAVDKRHLPILKLLLSLGFEVDFEDERNRTPLWRAVGNNHHDIAESLIEAGAEVNINDEDGDTPLLTAGLNMSQGIMRQLLKAGAEVNVRNKNGKTPLLYAVQNGYSDITQQLIKAHAEVNVRDKFGYTPLSCAIQHEYSDITQQLIQAGAKVNDEGEDGPPLLMAAQKRRSDIIQQLIEADADLNIRDADGGTPLLYTVLRGYSDITQQLIDAGAGVEVRDKDGQTPLLIATRQGDPDMTQQLIKAGVSLDSKDNQGQTALFIAIQRRNPVIIQMLIEGGAATGVKDNRGRTPLTLAEILKVDLPMHLAKAKDSVDEREG